MVLRVVRRRRRLGHVPWPQHRRGEEGRWRRQVRPPLVMLLIMLLVVAVWMVAVVRWQGQRMRGRRHVGCCGQRHWRLLLVLLLLLPLRFVRNARNARLLLVLHGWLAALAAVLAADSPGVNKKGRRTPLLLGAAALSSSPPTAAGPAAVLLSAAVLFGC